MLSHQPTPSQALSCLIASALNTQHVALLEEEVASFLTDQAESLQTIKSFKKGGEEASAIQAHKSFGKEVKHFLG